MSGYMFKTFDSLKNIPFDELTKKEKEALKRFPNYDIVRTRDRHNSNKREGSMIYEITNTEDSSLPTIRRELHSIFKGDPFAYIKRLESALEKAKSNFPSYTFEVIGKTKLDRPIYKITHFDTRLKPIVTENINPLSKGNDIFRIAFAKYVAIDKAREIFKDYIIEFYEEDEDLIGNAKIRCVVTYPNNKFNLKPRLKHLAPLSKGVDPFFMEYRILETLETARILNPNVEINLTDRLDGTNRICEVIGTNIVTGKKDVKYVTLCTLARGVNPFKNSSWDTQELEHGYFYVLKCENKEGKVGIMYGISINPYDRINSHLNYNKKLGTKTELISLYRNKTGIDKQCVLLLETYVKRNLGKNYFEKDECSTNTETISLDKLNCLNESIQEFGLESVSDEGFIRLIKELIKEKGLGDL